MPDFFGKGRPAAVRSSPRSRVDILRTFLVSAYRFILQGSSAIETPVDGYTLFLIYTYPMALTHYLACNIFHISVCSILLILPLPAHRFIWVMIFLSDLNGFMPVAHMSNKQVWDAMRAIFTVWLTPQSHLVSIHPIGGADNPPDDSNI